MTNSEVATGATRCWCGNADLAEFCATYARCARCGTLVSRRGLTPDEAEVRDDERDFYGKTYWLAHQHDVLGLPDIYERARLDLPERCLYWLRALLGYALPPACVLEVGSGHGAFVALMRWAGFDASGLEVSPWVVDFARATFGVPMLLGTIEAQKLPAGSLDVIVLNDVLEHLVDPQESMRHCVSLLRPNGFVLVQTPRYPDPGTHPELVKAAHPFLAMLQEREHLHLFSERAVRQLFVQVGLGAVRFEPAFFPYDMFLMASRAELVPTKSAEPGKALLRSASARLVNAMLDLDDRIRALSERARDVERDRQERIGTIERLNQHIEEVGTDYDARLKIILEQQAMIERLNQHIEKTSTDYEERLKVILEQQATIERLNQHIEKTSADYGTELKAILEKQVAIERLRHEGLRASTELETRQRLVDERMSEIVLVKDQLARVASGAEAQMRLIAQQHAAIEELLEKERRRTEALDGRLREMDGRLREMDGRQGEVDALLRGPLVRLLRTLRLL